MRQACLLGGTGFVGRHLVGELTRRGYAIKVLTRRRERRRELLVFPRVELVEANVHVAAELHAAFRGAHVVVNLVGILNEVGGATFNEVHVELSRKVVAACRQCGVPRLLHMSALRAGPAGPSRYLMSKGAGEDAAHDGDGVQVTSFRPSLMFGPDDDFFNRFATLLTAIPLAFPLAVPGARFAPVYVQDVAGALCRAVDDKTSFGQRYDLCGPRTYTLRELVEYTAALLRLRRVVIGLNDTLSRYQARLMELVPGKPFSRDNYLSLQVDNVSDENGLPHFGIEPTGIEAVVPRYLGARGRASRRQRLRRAARRPGGHANSSSNQPPSSSR